MTQEFKAEQSLQRGSRPDQPKNGERQKKSMTCGVKHHGRLNRVMTSLSTGRGWRAYRGGVRPEKGGTGETRGVRVGYRKKGEKKAGVGQTSTRDVCQRIGVDRRSEKKARGSVLYSEERG